MAATVYIRRFVRTFVPALIVLFIGASMALAQTKQLLMWQEDLNYLKKASGDELVGQGVAVVQFRNGIEFWLKHHPFSTVLLPSAPPQPWGIDELRNQVSLLGQAVETMLKEDPSQPFNLGVTTVSVTSEASPLSPVADSLNRAEIQNRQAVTVATALDYLPGLAIDRVAGRNEAGIRLRGFSNKGQIPFYVDGIPIQVPYDGTLDFNRFLTSDIAEIQVAKGYSSPLIGPNGLGGSINLVTRQPESKFESNALIGTGSGNTLLSSLQLGSRLQHFYVQGSVDWLQRDFIPLSGNFPLQLPSAPANRYQTTYEENQSNSRDEKYSGRIAWTPKGQNQYIFSYTNQKGEKGNPLYAGPNLNASNRYWKWPYWNKNSYYFITNTELGEASSVKFRLYYDQFRNGLSMFDNDAYLTMSNRNSGLSIYDDHSGGASSEFTTRIPSRNAISASFFFKDDTHKEYSIYPGRSPFPLNTPTLLDRTQQFSIGFQDVITITSRLRATFGFSADYLKGLQAQQFNSSQTGLIPLTCISEPNNASFSGCTAHVWNYNPQASLSYYLTGRDMLFATFADRGRFPLLKESYSYRLGTAIPNPDLNPEHNRNWNIGYSHAFATRTLAQIEYFRSDLRDSIQSVYIADPGSLCLNNTGALAGFCSQNVNIAREVHEGVEFSIRSTPTSRLTLDINYSYLNRNIAYAFANMPDVSQINTSISILPTLPKNKVIFNATMQLPHKVLAMANFRYEGGLTLQDTTYSPARPPYGASYGTVDLGTVAPIYAGLSLQAGIKNLFDRDYYYTAGYPESGRNWFFNLRYRF
jgi:iron complex outermembrane receptor protein